VLRVIALAPFCYHIDTDIMVHIWIGDLGNGQ
jgi:hypothetical protein